MEHSKHSCHHRHHFPADKNFLQRFSLSREAQEFLAHLHVHAELLAAARDDSRLILEKDAELQTERGQALRMLLYLFERDQAIQFLRSG